MPLALIGSVADSSTPGALTVSPEGETTFSSSEVIADPAASGAPMTNASFRYQIVENGHPTDYWVAGTAQTWDWSQAGGPSSTCQVFKGDPVDGGHLAGADAPYQCLTTIAAGSEATQAAFTVSPRLASLTPGHSTTSPSSGSAAAANGSGPAGSGASVNAVSSTGGSGTASGLAETGSSVPMVVILASLLALLAGAGLVASRRWRARHGQRG